MIFVTVGTQLEFDRMVSVVSEWAGSTGHDVFAQIGPTLREFSFVRYKQFLEPEEIDLCFEEAALVVAHAGMGSILTALSYGKPIIIMPRRASFNEHRNDHQLATAERFANKKGVWVAWDENDLVTLLNVWSSRGLNGGKRISRYAPPEFISKLQKLLGEP